ncbi:MAG: hypothetical protein QHH06_06545 [Clostridiales bacterium]|nr:hypothetical protein [Eubacteriales bacterium]MDH7566123.1 hypothetical protein [Clostridiales bacterium]
MTATRGKGLFLAIGWISAILSLFIYPPIFGVLGVIMGILSTKGGSRAGLAVIVASIVLMGIGLIYSGVLLNYLRHFMGL